MRAPLTSGPVAGTDQAGPPLLQVEGLSVHFVSRHSLLPWRVRRVRAVEQVDLTLGQEETLGVVGESGCGKTSLGRAILRLIQPTAGRVLLEGQDVLRLGGRQLRSIRRHMQIVFQNPYSSFDPRFTVLSAVAEPLRTHTTLRGQALVDRVVEVLEQCGMPGEMLYRYPHEFSGGQLQRIAIARALTLNPKLLVLDEPTSALDVSVQAQIINLLERLQRERRLGYLFISHDLSVVQHISDRIAVMYLGKIVELSKTEGLFEGQARHPYPQALLASAPIVDPRWRRERIVLQGGVPDPASPPPGCAFHPRCPQAREVCTEVAPELVEVGEGHLVACHRAGAEF